MKRSLNNLMLLMAGLMLLMTGAVMPFVPVPEAGAKPVRNGNSACEKFDTYAVCDTLPDPSNGYKWTRCVFSRSASGKQCETNHGNRTPPSYPPYNIAMRLWDIEHGGSEHPTR